ncbi:MAG: hypothetical protein H6605_08805 [Flavobacteriales bacterium]|nr:hypothetical protein [Flavobacteriales bacterium]
MNVSNFIPPFLKKIDHYLLTHYPILWQSRIHYVFYSVLLTNCLFGVVVLFTRINYTSELDMLKLVWTFMILSVTYLIIWMIHAGRFNLFKQYGKRPPGDEYLNFLLIFINVSLILSTMFAFPALYSLKAKLSISSVSLAKDINALNLGAAFFPNETYHYNTSEINGELYPGKVHLYDYNNFTRFGYNTFYRYTFGNIIVDPERQYEPFDQMEKDPLCRNKISRHGMYCDQYTKELFNRSSNKQEQLKLINDFIKVAEKYEVKVPHSAEHYLNAFNRDEDYLYRFSNNNYEQFRFIRDLEDRLSLAVEYKTGKNFLWNADFYHFMWYVIFYITLIFMIYKNVRRRDFILTIVSAVVIMVVTGILIAISGFNEDQTANMYMLIYVGLGFGAIKILFNRKHSWLNGACLNLTLLCLPFMPLFYYVMYHNKQYDEQLEIFGFVLTFVFLQILFKRLYTILWSLPE